MFTGESIQQVVDLFKKRGVMLYHSAQFVDFQSYVEMGGIPSRLLLEKNLKPYTRFDTDANDHQNKVWDKVFLNPLDFGLIFQNGRGGVPTVYGPISFVFDPEALLEAEDVAICLRSAGCPNFSRERECLKNIEEVEKIFRYDQAEPEYLRADVKLVPDLRKTFSLPYASNPEISMTIPTSRLSFATLRRIVVDPYMIQGCDLYDYVKEWSREVDFRTTFFRRSYPSNINLLVNEIVDLFVEHDVLTLSQIIELETVAPSLRDWAKRLSQKPGMEEQWRRYATYFYSGTLAQIHDDVKFLSLFP